MNYEFLFWIFFAFIVGVYLGNGRTFFYFGTDQCKYDKALIGVLISKK